MRVEPLPDRRDVDPLFDGHAERALDQLSVEERLDWIWEAMQLLRAGRAARAAQERASVPRPSAR